MPRARFGSSFAPASGRRFGVPLRPEGGTIARGVWDLRRSPMGLRAAL